MMFNDEDDDPLEVPLRFKEHLGEHTLTEDVRAALIFAATERFATEEDRKFLPKFKFTAEQKKLAQSTVFHGPYTDLNKTIEESTRRRGVVVAYIPDWTEKVQPVWVVCLAN